MTYYRPSPTRFVWGVVIALAILAALFVAGRATVRAIAADERARVMRSGDALLQQALAHGRRLAHERDSLAAVVARVDTVLVTRLQRVRDTAWLPADTASVVRLAACTAELTGLATDCASFRHAATTALAKADTSRRGDSTVIAGLSTQLAAIRRADSLKAGELTRRSRWRAIERGVCVGSVAANVFTFTR